MLMLNALRSERYNDGDPWFTQRGQATAEYALVIVGAATLAALVIAWATSTGKITTLLNAVINAVIGKIG